LQVTGPRLALLVLFAGLSVLQAAKPVVVGYLPHYRAGIIDKLPVEQLTDIIYFSVSPKADGSLNTANVKPAVLKKLTQRAHPKNTRVHICVGGWNLSAGFAPMTANAQARGVFVHSLTTFVRTHKLQGADIDWEHPKGETEIANYQKLLIELKRAFLPHRLWLTAAVAGWGRHVKPTTIPFIDRFHVMAYDQGTPHAPFDGALKDLRNWETQKVPKAKLVLGLPFYGRNAQGTAATYAEILRRHRPKPSADLAGGFHFNGPATIRRKTAYALQQQLAGVMIWELGQDAPGNSSLLRLVNKAIRAQPKR